MKLQKLLMLFAILALSFSCVLENNIQVNQNEQEALASNPATIKTVKVCINELLDASEAVQDDNGAKLRIPIGCEAYAEIVAQYDQIQCLRTFLNTGRVLNSNQVCTNYLLAGGYNLDYAEY